MTIEECYLVIGKYPNSPFRIGEKLLFNGICYISQESNYTINFPYEYPNIFKKIKTNANTQILLIINL